MFEKSKPQVVANIIGHCEREPGRLCVQQVGNNKQAIRVLGEIRSHTSAVTWEHAR